MTDRPLLFALIAVVLNAGAGYGAWRRGSVTTGGGIAGALVGTVILIAGGFSAWIMLMLFFVSSSLASRLGSRRKERLARMHEKGSRRDAVQVVANGGVAAVALVAWRLTGSPALLVAAAGAFAAVNADTWASELGVLARRRPRSIVTWRALEPGTSGGVSLPGTLAGVAGSALIAGWFALALGPRASFLVVTAAGVIGTTADSFLGATVQALYRDASGSITERRVGEDGAHMRLRGLPFVTNDVVNLLSSAIAAGSAGLFATMLGG